MGRTRRPQQPKATTMNTETQREYETEMPRASFAMAILKSFQDSQPINIMSTYTQELDNKHKAIKSVAHISVEELAKMPKTKRAEALRQSKKAQKELTEFRLKYCSFR
jgi:hypothetical protein